MFFKLSKRVSLLQFFNFVFIILFIYVIHWLMINLCIGGQWLMLTKYKFSKAKIEPELAQMKLLEIRDLLENLNKGTDEFYLSINDTDLHYVVKATFIHMLCVTNLLEECKLH